MIEAVNEMNEKSNVIEMSNESKKTRRHDPDSVHINLWVAKHVLAMWDEYCEKMGVNRSDLIKNAVNDKVQATREVESNPATEKIMGKITELQAEFRTMRERASEEASGNPPDPDLKAQIYTLLGESKRGLRSDEIAGFLKAREKDVIAILMAGIKDFVENPVDSRWNIIEKTVNGNVD